ncbi:MAG TPA: hypothetical protein VHL32_10890 [Gemmatimonadaceae bacterium]|jgi:hypothetical protein|nr:hypothetical protein [Gemmatimonadaceae bacterium]
MRILVPTLIAVAAALAPAASANSQVPLHDPDAQRAEEAQRGYVSAMKTDLRQFATAEEAYFSDKMSYFAGTVDASHPLYGFSPSKSVTINVTGGSASGDMWTATATHALTRTKCIYHLPDPIACEAPAPPPKPAADLFPNGQTTTIGDTSRVTIKPGQWRRWGWTISPLASSCLFSGQVAALSGGDGKINLLIMTDSAYADWAQGRWAQSYFESGERSTIPFDVHINDAGHYVLVVANPSKTDAKIVQLQHTEVSCSE